MGRASNPARIVDVAGVTYYWRATPDILQLVIAVWPRNLAGARLTAVVPISRNVTAKLVRQVVETALAGGYNPRDGKAAPIEVPLL